MSNLIKVTQGDDLPAILLSLKDSNSGDRGDSDTWDPIDVSGTTVVSVNLRLKGGDGTILGVATTTRVTDGTDGEILMNWPTGFLDNDTGLYEGEIFMDYDGPIQTVDEKLRIKIKEQF